PRWEMACTRAENGSGISRRLFRYFKTGAKQKRHGKDQRISISQICRHRRCETEGQDQGKERDKQKEVPFPAVQRAVYTPEDGGPGEGADAVEQSVERKDGIELVQNLHHLPCRCTA